MHVEVVLPDQAVQVGVEEGQRWARAPVPEQPVLHVLRAQRLAQQRVVLQVDHAERQVVAGAPERVEAMDLLVRQRRSRGGGACSAEGGQGCGSFETGCLRRHARSLRRPPAPLRQHLPRVAGHHQLLVRVDDPRRHPAPGRGDAGAARGVRPGSSSTPSHSASRQTRSRTALAFSPMPPVNTTASSPRRSAVDGPELSGDPVHEQVHGQPGAGVARSEQRAHVARGAGHAQQPGVVVEQPLDVRRLESARGQQPKHGSGVERATARAHAQAVEDAEGHGRRDAPPAAQGAHARAVAEVHHDRPPRAAAGSSSRSAAATYS